MLTFICSSETGPLQCYTDAHCHLDRLLDLYGVYLFTQYELDDRIGIPMQCSGVMTNFIDPHLYNCFAHFCVINPPTEFRVWATVGLHPKNANSFDEEFRKWTKDMLSKFAHKKIKGLGETGIDTGSTASLETQLRSLDWHIETAITNKLTLVLHCRGGADEFDSLLEQCTAAFSKHPGRDRVHKIHFHCFTYGRDKATEWLAQFPCTVFGVTNMITTNSSQRLRSIADVDLSKLVLETDSPHLLPRGYTAHNYCPPGLIMPIVEEICQIRLSYGHPTTAQTVIARTTEAFCTAYDIPIAEATSRRAREMSTWSS